MCTREFDWECFSAFGFRLFFCWLVAFHFHFICIKFKLCSVCRLPPIDLWGLRNTLPLLPSPLLRGFFESRWFLSAIGVSQHLDAQFYLAGLLLLHRCWAVSICLVLWRQVKPEERHRPGLSLSKSWAQPAGKAAVQQPRRGAGPGGARPRSRQQVSRAARTQPEEGPGGISPVLEVAEGAPSSCGYDFISEVHPAQTRELPLKEYRRRRAPGTDYCRLSSELHFNSIWPSLKHEGSEFGGRGGKDNERRIEKKNFPPRSSSQWCFTLW